MPVVARSQFLDPHVHPTPGLSAEPSAKAQRGPLAQRLSARRFDEHVTTVKGGEFVIGGKQGPPAQWPRCLGGEGWVGVWVMGLA